MLILKVKLSLNAFCGRCTEKPSWNLKRKLKTFFIYGIVYIIKANIGGTTLEHKIHNDLFERINYERFGMLLKSAGITYSQYDKQALSKRIEDAVNGKLENKNLTIEMLDNFIADEISHGKNRKLYISSITPMIATYLKDLQFVKASLRKNQFCEEPINKLRTLFKPTERELGYLKYSFNEGDLVKISLCFVDTHKDEIETECESTNYLWVDIYPFEEKMIIKIWLKAGNIFAAQSTMKKMYDEILDVVKNLFSISIRSTIGEKQILFKIFKHLTDVASRPFRKQVASLEEKVDGFSTECATILQINNESLHVDLPYRIKRLFERVLIQANFDLYEKPAEGKIGYVTKVSFSDATGANVKARAAINREIQTADIFFDTRDTLEEIKNMDKLWVVWFYQNGKEIEKVETKIEVFPYYYVIHFTRLYTTKEAEELVLSNFKQFEDSTN